MLCCFSVQANPSEKIYKLLKYQDKTHSELEIKCSAFSIENKKLITASHCFKNFFKHANDKLVSIVKNSDKLNFLNNLQKYNLPIQILDNKDKVIFDSIHNREHRATLETFILPEMIPVVFPALLQAETTKNEYLKKSTPNYNLLAYPHIADALVLKLEGADIKTTPYSTDKVSPNETLSSIGFPYGDNLETKTGKTFDYKILEEAIFYNLPSVSFSDSTKTLLSDFLVVTDYEILLGMSGGMILNSKDEVVALLSATKSEEIELHNFSFGIKIDKVLNFFPKKFNEYKESLKK